MSNENIDPSGHSTTPTPDRPPTLEQEVAARFFAIFDHATNPDLLGMEDESQDERIASILAAKNLLKQRVLDRRNGAAEHSLPSMEPAAVRELSKIQLRSMIKCFGSSRAPLLVSAFEWFALGELRQSRWSEGRRLWNCEPDSANVFLFAEFGIVACQQGVDTKQWLALLSTLVRMQALYLYAYGNGEPQEYLYYHSERFKPVDPAKILGRPGTMDHVRRKLRSEYQPDEGNLEKLIGRALANAKRAFVKHDPEVAPVVIVEGVAQRSRRTAKG